MNVSLNSQKTSYISSQRASYGVTFVMILEEIDCVIKSFRNMWVGGPIAAWTNWVIFGRGHFQMHFYEIKLYRSTEDRWGCSGFTLSVRPWGFQSLHKKYLFNGFVAWHTHLYNKSLDLYQLSSWLGNILSPFMGTVCSAWLHISLKFVPKDPVGNKLTFIQVLTFLCSSKPYLNNWLKKCV